MVRDHEGTVPDHVLATPDLIAEAENRIEQAGEHRGGLLAPAAAVLDFERVVQDHPNPIHESAGLVAGRG